MFPWPVVYWTFSFIGLHILPSSMGKYKITLLIVYFGLFPTWFALIASEEYNQFLFFIGVFVALGGVVFESIGRYL